jgi:hypothetical protein
MEEITKLERIIALLTLAMNKTLDGSTKEAMKHAIEVMREKITQLQNGN